MARKCHVVGCSRSVARKGFMWAMLREVGLTEFGASYFASEFGDGACAYHCAEAVKGCAFRAGLEIRETKEKIKVIGHKQPDKHYPADHHSRVRRLQELEEELRRPSQVKVALNRLEAKVKSLKQRQAEAEQAKAQEAQRVQLYQYLKSQGYDDPARLFNL